MSSHIYVFITYYPLMVMKTNFVVRYYIYYNFPHILKNTKVFLLNIMYIINETIFVNDVLLDYCI